MNQSRFDVKLIGWFSLIFFVTQLPIYAVQYPNIQDLTNHIARLSVQLGLSQSAALQAHYEVSWGLSPNLALDALGQLLGPLFGPALAVKFLLSMGSLLMASGAWALNRVLVGRTQAWVALMPMVLLQNYFVVLGFVNYVLSIGLSLWLLAAWIHVRQGQVSNQLGLRVFFTLAAVTLYLVHLYGFAVYLIAIGVYELVRGRLLPGFRYAGVAAWRVGQQAVIPLGIHLLAYVRGTDLPVPIFGEGLIDVATRKVLYLAMSPVLMVGEEPSGLTQILLSLLIVVPFAILHKMGRFSVYVKWLLASWVIAFMALPRHGFGSAMVDLRMLLPMALVFCAGIALPDPGPKASFDHRAGWVALALVSVLTSVRWIEWQALSATQRDLRVNLATLPIGSRLAVTDLRGGRMPSRLVSSHAAAWAVVDRQVLLSSLFARPFGPFAVGYSPAGLSTALALRDTTGGSRVANPDELAKSFDHVAVFGEAADVDRYAQGQAVLFKHGGVALIRLGRD